MNTQARALGRLALLLAAGPALLAQSQTGTLVTQVKGQDGKPIAGVRVTLSSAALQGTRSGMTDANGVYRAPLLPPGAYTGTVTKEGFRTVGLSAVVPLGGSTSVEAVLRPEEVAAVTVVVTGTATKLSKESVGRFESISQPDLVEKLPLARTLQGMTFLAPGVVTGPGSRPSFSGAETFENKYLLDGVDVNDNIFNTPNALFIEDAIQETQILTNNVSAEYGRFSGGVIASILKRGSNQFEGSFRVLMVNQAWNALRPGENPNLVVNKITPVYTVTVGGPIIKDKLWYFVAARSEETETSISLPLTSAQAIEKRKDTRGNLTLTYSLNPNHSFSGSYTYDKFDGSNLQPLLGVTADPRSLYGRDDKQSLMSLRYSGLLSTNMNVELLLTKKLQKIFSNGELGETFEYSPVLSKNAPSGYLYNSRYFGSAPEYRNNWSVIPKFSYYFDLFGSHDLKVGGEIFEEARRAANRQSPSDHVITANVNVDPTTKAITYEFIPGTGGSGSLVTQWEAPGGTLSSRYTALFVSDNWKLDEHLNFTLGARYERMSAKFDDTGRELASTSGAVPRVGINYDLKGDGKLQFAVNYAVYLSKLSQTRLAVETTVGNPIQRAFDYIGSQYTTGTNTGSGFQRSGYSATPYFVSDPTANVKLNPNVKAPLTRELTFEVKKSVGSTGSFTAAYVYRKYTRMLENYMGTTGTTNVNGRDFWNIYWTNAPDNLVRRYSAIQLSLEDRLENFYYRAFYTFSRQKGNYESEGGNVVGGGSGWGNWDPARPDQEAGVGFLGNDRTHDFRLISYYVFKLGANRLSVGGNFQFQSGTPYSHVLTGQPSVTTGVYPANSPAVATYTRYYSGRGDFRLPDVWYLDLSAQWDGSITKKLGYFAKLTLSDALNSPQVRTFFTGGRAARYYPNPTTQPTTYTTIWSPDPRYGKPQSTTDWVGNRRVQLDIGFKF